MDGDLKNVIKYWIEGEITTFIKLWISVSISLCYCFFAAKMATMPVPRLLLFLPVLYLFFLLPLNLRSVHLCGITAFFVTWLSSFKLLLHAFNRGPLSDHSISLPRFLILACLPIKIQRKYLENRADSSQNAHFQEKPSVEISENRQKSAVSYAVKAVLLGLIIRIYDYSDGINPRIMMFIYCFHIYFFLEMILAVVAALARVSLGLELEPQFNEPYLSTSLQDFWGRRWNLMVTRILRPTVYNPVLSVSTKLLGRKWAAFPAVFSTFVVSGLMHELIFFYVVRVKPTWEVTWFFLLHGACLVVEIAAKKALKGRCRFPRILGTILTVGFVMLSSFWLFFPQMLRCKADVRMIAEYAILNAFVKDISRALTIG